MKKKILIITLVLALIGGSALFTTNSELFQGFSGKKKPVDLKQPQEKTICEKEITKKGTCYICRKGKETISEKCQEAKAPAVVEPAPEAEAEPEPEPEPEQQESGPTTGDSDILTITQNPLLNSESYNLGRNNNSGQVIMDFTIKSQTAMDLNLGELPVMIRTLEEGNNLAGLIYNDNNYSYNFRINVFTKNSEDLIYNNYDSFFSDQFDVDLISNTNIDESNDEEGIFTIDWNIGVNEEIDVIIFVEIDNRSLFNTLEGKRIEGSLILNDDTIPGGIESPEMRDETNRRVGDISQFFSLVWNEVIINIIDDQ